VKQSDTVITRLHKTLAEVGTSAGGPNQRAEEIFQALSRVLALRRRVGRCP